MSKECEVQKINTTTLLQQALSALEQYTTPDTDLSGRPTRAPIDKLLCLAIRAHLARPQPEPVAWVDPRNIASAKVSQDRGGPFDAHVWSEGKTAIHTMPLYAAQPAPVPLTEEWIAQFFMQLPLPYDQVEKIVRHVERAHGIGAAP